MHWFRSTPEEEEKGGGDRRRRKEVGEGGRGRRGRKRRESGRRGGEGREGKEGRGRRGRGRKRRRRWRRKENLDSRFIVKINNDNDTHPPVYTARAGKYSVVEKNENIYDSRAAAKGKGTTRISPII